MDGPDWELAADVSRGSARENVGRQQVELEMRAETSWERRGDEGVEREL